MSPSEARREAHRILRNSQLSVRRSIAEAERLLQIADGEHDERACDLRRSEAYELQVNPEFFTIGAEL
jgi:hypothetical protein